MSVIDCNNDIKGYHSAEVTLGRTEQKAMRTRRDAGRNRLKDGLTAAKHPKPCGIYSQGSYSMRTMVQDAQNDYDIDDGVYFEAGDLRDSEGKELGPEAARKMVASALKDHRFNYDAKVKPNCVRQFYEAGYHIDMPVYRVLRSKDLAGKEIEKYELASSDQWVESDAREVTSWYNGEIKSELEQGQEDISQLRRITKLTKKMARSRIDWKKKTASGICVTKLVIDNKRLVADREDLALRRTWQSILAQLSVSLRIPHPVPLHQGKNLAEDNDEQVKFFRDCLAEQLETLKILDRPKCTQKEARQAWDTVFNCKYFSDRPDNGGNGGSKTGGPFIISGSDTKRNDGDRRFG
jgi:hypothetical protein